MPSRHVPPGGQIDRQDESQGDSWFIDDCTKASASLLEAIAAMDAPFLDDSIVFPLPTPSISAPDSAAVESSSASSSVDYPSQGHSFPMQEAIATPAAVVSASRSESSIFPWGAHTPGNGHPCPGMWSASQVEWGNQRVFPVHPTMNNLWYPHSTEALSAPLHGTPSVAQLLANADYTLPLLDRMLGSDQQYLSQDGQLAPPHLPWAFTRAPPYAAWDGPLAVYGKRSEEPPLRKTANKRTRRSPSFAEAISSSAPLPTWAPVHALSSAPQAPQGVHSIRAGVRGAGARADGGKASDGEKDVCILPAAVITLPQNNKTPHSEPRTLSPKPRSTNPDPQAPRPKPLALSPSPEARTVAAKPAADIPKTTNPKEGQPRAQRVSVRKVTRKLPGS